VEGALDRAVCSHRPTLLPALHLSLAPGTGVGAGRAAREGASEPKPVPRVATLLEVELRVGATRPSARGIRESDPSPNPVTNGPFIETKEIVAGYYIVDCMDLARAVEIAGKLGEPTLWPSEVRRIDP
jgi:hypothetical protein